MKLRDLLSEINKVQLEIGASKPYICGGAPRDRYLGNLTNISDLDITTGDKTVDYLSQHFYLSLKKRYNVIRKIMSDGHSTVYVGNLKVDFSSNYNVPNIEGLLKKQGIINPTEMQKEIYSRDFTCNALLMSFDLSNIFDPTKRGLKDIKEKKIKTCLPPEITLVTNKNRVVRSIYLACKLGFDIDDSIINFVKNNPESINISTPKSLAEKLNAAFDVDGDRASFLLNKMNLWNYIPVTEKAYPYYIKSVKGKPNV